MINVGKTSLIQQLMERKLRIPNPVHQMEHKVRLSRKGENENQPTFKMPSFGGGFSAKSLMPKIDSGF